MQKVFEENNKLYLNLGSCDFSNNREYSGNNLNFSIKQFKICLKFRLNKLSYKQSTFY